MTLKPIHTCLFLVATAAMTTKARAAFQYDLRFTSTGNPTAPSADLQSVANPEPGVYHLQLWAQISGDADLTNDAWTAGWFYITNSTASSLLFSGSGAGIQNVAIPSTWEFSQVGTVGDANSDGVA